MLVGEHNISADVLNITSKPPEFLPSRVDLGDAQQLQVTIEYTITNNHACTNQTSQQVTIFAPPDADFQIGDNQTAFTPNDPPVSLIPNQGVVTSEYWLENRIFLPMYWKMNLSDRNFSPVQLT